jgi:hypothetical protein
MPQLILRRYLVNDQTLEGSAVVNASGVGTIVIGQTPSAYYVEVERITVDAATGATDFTLYATSVDSTVFVRERFDFGTDTVAVIDESTPIRFRPSEQIIAELTGGTTGDTVIVYLQAWTVLFNPEELQEQVGPGTVITSGEHAIGPSDAPEQVAWD